MLRPLLLVLALAVAAGGVQAANPPVHAVDADTLPPYDKLDVDQDGVVTLPEIVVTAPAMAERIRHCDTDRDEKISRDEYAACKPRAAPAAGTRDPLR